MEYCAGGDLAQLIQDRKQKRLAGRLNSMLPQEFILKVFYQLLQALKELHQNQQGKILHRYLKPANVFLTSAMGDVKLGDFGLARVLSSEVSMAISYVGTPYYMSPEQVAKMRYNESSDVWSLGCLIYELCALHPPFTAKDQKELYGKIKKGEFRRIPHAYSDELFTTLSSMLKQNPELRPSVQSLLQMSFINPAIMPKPKRSTTPRISRVGSLKRDSIATKDSINSSGYKSHDTNTSTPISKPSPPLNKQLKKPSRSSSNNNVAYVNLIPDSPSPIKPLERSPSKRRKTELELKIWEERLLQREKSLDEREKRLDELQTELEKKSRVLQPVKATTNSPRFDAIAKLQNRLVPLSIRHKASKLVRSPSDPSRISKI